MSITLSGHWYASRQSLEVVVHNLQLQTNKTSQISNARKVCEQIYSSASYSYSDSRRKRDGLGWDSGGGVLCYVALKKSIKALR